MTNFEKKNIFSVIIYLLWLKISHSLKIQKIIAEIIWHFGILSQIFLISILQKIVIFVSKMVIFIFHIVSFCLKIVSFCLKMVGFFYTNSHFSLKWSFYRQISNNVELIYISGCFIILRHLHVRAEYYKIHSFYNNNFK